MLLAKVLVFLFFSYMGVHYASSGHESEGIEEAVQCDCKSEASH